MLRSYLTVALRALQKHKTHAIINVTGLALALAVCVLIALYVRHEMSYDQFHEHADRIVQVTQVAQFENEESRTAMIPAPLPAVLRTRAPGVEQIVALKSGTVVAKQGNELFEAEALYAGPSFFEMFSFPLAHGASGEALRAPNGVVLTTEQAERLFGRSDVMGETLQLRLDTSFETFTVTGVADPAPATSSIPLHIVLPFSRLQDFDRSMQDPSWRTLSPLLYAQLSESGQTAELERALRQIRVNEMPDAEQRHFELLPITETHLTPEVYGQLRPTSRPLYTYILIGVGALILGIACINFVTLAVGRSVERAHEVGVRKTMGASRGHVMAQFWGEAALLCVAALVLGLIAVQLALPTFSKLVEVPLSARSLLTPGMALILAGVLGVVGLAAGGYPAVVLSGFQPVAVLRGRVPGGGPSRTVQGLVVVQFALSIVLVAGTITMWRQVDLVQTKDLGFQHEQVVQVDARLAQGQSQQLLDRYQQLAESSSAVQHVTGAWSNIAVEGALPNRFDAQSGSQTVKTHAWRTHYNVVETLGLTLSEGRGFDPAYGADAAGRTVVVNEALVDAFGWEDPIGKTLSVQFHVQEAEVVGVVKDFHFQSLRQEIAPLLFHMRPIAPTNQLFARIAPGQTAQALDELQRSWNETVSDLPFSLTFLDAAVDQQYRADRRWARIVTYAAGFALFIAGLGLFGLASLSVQRRTKEIGVRKVLGATTRHIVALLSTDFARLVGIAFVLAVPVAYWGADRWLRNFAYRIDLGPWVFAGAGGLALLVALAAVGAHAFRAARLDPTTTLRDG